MVDKAFKISRQQKINSSNRTQVETEAKALLRWALLCQYSIGIQICHIAVDSSEIWLLSMLTTDSHSAGFPLDLFFFFR